MKVGNDIVEVKRFFELVSNKKFISRVFTDKEQAHIFALKDKQKQAERMAGKYSAKEAIAKALGFGISEGIDFLSLEVLPNEKGAPVVFLHNKALEIFQKHFSQIEVSISNTANSATAVCVLI